MTCQAKVIAGGKIAIPAELRRELGIRDGDLMAIERDEEGRLVLETYRQVVREVRAEVRKLMGPQTTSMVDELIAERRAEGAREDAEAAAWLAKSRR